MSELQIPEELTDEQIPDDLKIRCETCSGRKTLIRGASFGLPQSEVRCYNCHGKGWILPHQDRLIERIVRLSAENATLREQVKEALRITTSVPEDILLKWSKPVMCGVSDVSQSFNMSAQRFGGCGQKICEPTAIFRCADCGVPFHQKCLQKHCPLEIEALREQVARYEQPVSDEEIKKFDPGLREVDFADVLIAGRKLPEKP